MSKDGDVKFDFRGGAKYIQVMESNIEKSDNKSNRKIVYSSGS